MGPGSPCTRLLLAHLGLALHGEAAAGAEVSAGVPAPRRVKRAPRRCAQPQTPSCDHFHTPGSQEMAAGGCRSPAGSQEQGPGRPGALGVAAAHRDLGPA